ncbi:MAG: beta-ketoacyl synthase chain length factor [Burkholderiaceae bacterium]
MSTLVVSVGGIGAWSKDLRGWQAMRDALRGIPFAAPDDQVGRPAALLLPAAERRRAPDGVAVALEAAREALVNFDGDPASLASVFASAHGELAIVDYLCDTLAHDPLALSPTRFHHSVHNAAAGYWTIATTSRGPSTSIAAGDASFALGLLEAVTQVVAETRPVLLVVFDTPTVGLLARAAPNAALFGAALLLKPLDEQQAGPALSLTLEARTASRPMPADPRWHDLAQSSPAAHAVALLDLLARGASARVDYPVGVASTVSVNVLCEADAEFGTVSTRPIE